MSLNAIAEAPVAMKPSGTGAVSWYAYLLVGTFTYLVSMQGNILPFLRADLGLGYGMVSLHISAMAGGMLVVGLFGDRVGRRFGRADTLRLGILGAGGAAILLCLAPAAWASIASCALLGLFGALVPSTAYAVLTDLNPGNRGVTFAKANAVSYAFAIMVPILAGILVTLGWNWRLIPLTGAAAGAAILAAHAHLIVPNSPEEDTAAAAAHLPICFWLYWLTLGFVVAVEFSVLLWAPAFLEKAVGMPAAHAAIGAAAFFVAMLSGRIAGIWLLRVVASRLLFFGAAATTLMGYAIYAAAAGPTLAVVGLFVLGLGIALLFPLVMSAALGSVGHAVDKASSRVVLAPALAILLSPPLLGALADAAGLRFAQNMTPVLMIAAVAIYLSAGFIRRKAVKTAPAAQPQR